MKTSKINYHTLQPSKTIIPSLNKPSTSTQYNYPHQFITAYGPKTIVRTDVSAAVDRTKQSFKDECDINHIMARYQRTGVLDFANKHEGQYGDCTGIDFEAGMQLITRARSMFNDMPAHLRARFENEPAKFLEFVQNPKNLEEARELGLCKPAAPEATPLPTPPLKDVPELPLNRQAVRKQAREDAERKERSDD